MTQNLLEVLKKDKCIDIIGSWFNPLIPLDYDTWMEQIKGNVDAHKKDNDEEFRNNMNRNWTLTDNDGEEEVITRQFDGGIENEERIFYFKKVQPKLNHPK